MTTHLPISQEAKGRWPQILTALGIASPQQLTGKHSPCPCCGGGRDRFRFDNLEGRGTWICNQCGAGDGIALVRQAKNLDFRAAADLVRSALPGAAVTDAPARRPSDPRPHLERWRKAAQLNGSDPASLYLANRCLPHDTNSGQLRFTWLTYVHEDGRRTTHPGMVALFVAPDNSAATVRYTFLTDTGQKAPVPVPRKFAPLPVPVGGAVRLSPSAEVMGVAEGTETALAAQVLFGLPVWAAMDCHRLAKWEPPAKARSIIIFADNDANFAGQNGAYELAQRLSKEKRLEVDVRVPPQVDTDWNEVLIDKRGGA